MARGAGWPAGRHAGVRIGEADLLVPPGLLRVPDAQIGFGVLSHIAIRVRHGTDMANREALPADIGPDQRCIDMHDLALGDPGRHTAPDRPLEDAPKSLRAPALANTGQRRMIRQPLVQAVPREPADREIDLCLSHQTPVMNDPQQEAGQHQAHCRLRRDPGPTRAGGVEIGHVLDQPPQIEHPVDAGQDMIVRNKLTQRPADEKHELIPVLMADHHGLRFETLAPWNQRREGFSTAPPCSAVAGWWDRLPQELPKIPWPHRRPPVSER